MKKDLVKYLEKEISNFKPGQRIYDYLTFILKQVNQLDEPELPEIPDYVAEYITYMKEKKTLVEVVYLSLEQIELGTGAVEPIDFWISRFGDKFSRAWLDGFTVEEQKYYVLNKNNKLMLRKYTRGVRELDISNSMTVDSEFFEFERFALTEQEIKDYDERFWPFAKPVEEVE